MKKYLYLIYQILYKCELDCLYKGITEHRKPTILIGRNLEDMIIIYCDKAKSTSDLSFIYEFLDSLIKHNLIDPQYITLLKNNIVNKRYNNLEYYNHNLNINEEIDDINKSDICSEDNRDDVKSVCLSVNSYNYIKSKNLISNSSKTNNYNLTNNKDEEEIDNFVDLVCDNKVLKNTLFVLNSMELSK